MTAMELNTELAAPCSGAESADATFSLAITARILQRYDILLQTDLKEDSPLAVVTLGKEVGLGHARLGDICIHS